MATPSAWPAPHNVCNSSLQRTILSKLPLPTTNHNKQRNKKKRGLRKLGDRSMTGHTKARLVQQWHKILDADLPELSDHNEWAKRYLLLGRLVSIDVEKPCEEVPAGSLTIERYADKYLGTIVPLMKHGTTYEVKLHWYELCYFMGLTERYATSPPKPLMHNQHFLCAWRWAAMLASDLGPHPHTGEDKISMERLEVLTLGAMCIQRLLLAVNEHLDSRIVNCWLAEMINLDARESEMAYMDHLDPRVVRRFREQLKSLDQIWSSLNGGN